MRLPHAGLGACLAHDLGLGKTAQTLAVPLQRAALGCFFATDRGRVGRISLWRDKASARHGSHGTKESEGADATVEVTARSPGASTRPDAPLRGACFTIRPISSIRVHHMKTMIELPDDLLERSKAVARRENSTLTALIEEGPRLALRARARKRAAPFVVVPFEGNGLSPEFVGAG